KTIDVPDATGPMVLGDGVVISVRASDRVLLANTTATSFVSAQRPATPLVVGDLALFELEHELRVIHLPDGQPGPAIPALQGKDSPAPFEMKAWRGGFVIQQSRFGDTDYADHLERLAVVDVQGVADLALPALVRDPQLLVPAGTRAYVKTYTAGGEP